MPMPPGDKKIIIPTLAEKQKKTPNAKFNSFVILATKYVKPKVISSQYAKQKPKIELYFYFSKCFFFLLSPNFKTNESKKIKINIKVKKKETIKNITK